jgi:hypothetical protein
MPNQHHFVVQLDGRVHQLLANGGTDDDLLIVFSDDQIEMKKILLACTPNELNSLCLRYADFDRFLQCLEILACGSPCGITHVFA